MRAMILAAGLGTRLRPLTFERSKPAIPLLGKPLVVRLIEKLAADGIGPFRLNLHHLPESIERVFSVRPWDALPVSFSYEPVILGTAGGLKANETFFQDGTFVMANADIVADFPLHEAIAFHRKREAVATLLLYPQEPPFRHTPIRIDEQGRLHDFKGAGPATGRLRTETYLFTGVHILEPEIFEFIPRAAVSEINNEIYPAALRAGRRVLGFPVEGYWNDLGDPARYLEAQRDLLRLSNADPLLHVAADAEIVDLAGLGSNVSVEAGCRVEPGAEVQDSILWEDVVIRSAAQVRSSIIGSGITVDSACVNRIVTRFGEAPIVRS